MINSPEHYQRLGHAAALAKRLHRSNTVESYRFFEARAQEVTADDRDEATRLFNEAYYAGSHRYL